MEAMELYEMAAEEYKVVHGDQQSHDERLHFTDMRRGALKHIANDVEARGLEVFQEVQQVVSAKQIMNIVHVLVTECRILWLWLMISSVHSLGCRLGGRGHGDCQLYCCFIARTISRIRWTCDTSNGTMLSKVLVARSFVDKSCGGCLFAANSGRLR